jgi:hypothetical protein
MVLPHAMLLNSAVMIFQSSVQQPIKSAQKQKERRIAAPPS